MFNVDEQGRTLYKELSIRGMDVSASSCVDALHKGMPLPSIRTGAQCGTAAAVSSDKCTEEGIRPPLSRSPRIHGSACAAGLWKHTHLCALAATASECTGAHVAAEPANCLPNQPPIMRLCTRRSRPAPLLPWRRTPPTAPATLPARPLAWCRASLRTRTGWSWCRWDQAGQAVCVPVWVGEGGARGGGRCCGQGVKGIPCVRGCKMKGGCGDRAAPAMGP